VLMKQSTIGALLRAYSRLQVASDELYDAAQTALDNNDFSDASLLQSIADKLYEEGIDLEHLINELEEQ
jgi:phage shock protein A